MIESVIGVVALVLATLGMWQWGKLNRKRGESDYRERMLKARENVQNAIFDDQDKVTDYYRTQIDVARALRDTGDVLPGKILPDTLEI